MEEADAKEEKTLTATPIPSLPSSLALHHYETLLLSIAKVILTLSFISLVDTPPKTNRAPRGRDRE